MNSSGIEFDRGQSGIDFQVDVGLLNVVEAVHKFLRKPTQIAQLGFQIGSSALKFRHIQEIVHQSLDAPRGVIDQLQRGETVVIPGRALYDCIMIPLTKTVCRRLGV